MNKAMTRTDHATHHAAAWGGALCALAGWWHGWSFPAGGGDWLWRSWPGHALVDALEAAGTALAGALAGGWYWWRTAAWGQAGIAGAAGLLATGLAAFAGWLPGLAVAVAGGVFVVAAAAAGRQARPAAGMGWRQWLRLRRPWNAAFFIFLILLAAGGDALRAGQSPPGGMALTAFLTTRLLTYAVAACALWAGLWLGERWWPRLFARMAWGAVMFAPLLIATDTVLRLSWSKSLYQLCAELENRGRVDFLKIREGTGLTLTPGTLTVLTLLLLAGPACYGACRGLSRRCAWQVSGGRLAAVAAAAWVLLAGVNLIASGLQSRAWQKWESRNVWLRLPPVAPERGVTSFDVVAANPVAAVQPFTPAEKPDIFLFIIETLRADAIQPAHAPHLTQFQRDCQPVGDAWSASNSTHLSWFGIFHGRLPWYAESLPESPSTAPLIALPRAAGYSVEVRSAGNFDYAGMTRTIFGNRADLSIFEHVPEGTPHHSPLLPQREQAMISRLLAALDTAKPGGVFRITALDSAHYPYRWPEEFTPPYADYERNPVFPVMPGPEGVARVQRRYWNAVAWNDHLFGLVMERLKQQGRYDGAFIIVTGDHGEEFKEQGSWFHCSSLNAAQTRVPLLIKCPASLACPTPRSGEASHLDILPTVLDTLGAPAALWAQLPGRSLRRGPPATAIIHTCYSGQSGETLLWRRDGWEAAFSWPDPWKIAPPGSLRLERLEGPGGPLELPGPEAWREALREHFPDAPARVFTRWEPAE